MTFISILQFSFISLDLTAIQIRCTLNRTEKENEESKGHDLHQKHGHSRKHRRHHKGLSSEFRTKLSKRKTSGVDSEVAEQMQSSDILMDATENVQQEIIKGSSQNALYYNLLCFLTLS